MQGDLDLWQSDQRRVDVFLYCCVFFVSYSDDECILSLQDDVQSTPAEPPPSFKPPPPPGAQRRQGGRDVLIKCPSSESSQSGLYFTAPRESARAPSSPRHKRDPSQQYATIKKKNPSSQPKKEKMTSAQLATVSQHNIGPFPRVQSPSRGPKPAAPSPSPPPPPPPLPAPPPPPSLPSKAVSLSKASLGPSPASKQQFVTVEVHRPNAEPDVNEVRPLPQARGNQQLGSLFNTTEIQLRMCL